MATVGTWWSRQPWIYRATPDLVFVLAPAFVATLAVLLLPSVFGEGKGLGPMAWLVLVAGVDVAHVYSTLWRTYLDPQERRKYRLHFILIPLLAYLVGALLHLLGGMLFWRVLAYLAVFHFIRQQYGFMALYARKDGRLGWERQLDAATIYAATLYPLIHWHTHLPRPFNWFVEGDFLALNAPWLAGVAGGVYLGLLLAYFAKEVFMAYQGRALNLPKNLVLLGTAISWYVGIILMQGDLAFTATNVLAHGIPYMALVWMYGRKKAAKAPIPAVGIGKYFQLRMLPVYLGLLLVIAYFEEGIWDALVWRDHVGLFPWAAELPNLSDPLMLALVVPLLAVPQVTHYVLDGFIWKMRREDGDLRKMEN